MVGVMGGDRLGAIQFRFSDRQWCGQKDRRLRIVADCHHSCFEPLIPEARFFIGLRPDQNAILGASQFHAGRFVWKREEGEFAFGKSRLSPHPIQ